MRGIDLLRYTKLNPHYLLFSFSSPSEYLKESAKVANRNIHGFYFESP